MALQEVLEVCFKGSTIIPPILRKPHVWLYRKKNLDSTSLKLTGSNFSSIALKNFIF